MTIDVHGWQDQGVVGPLPRFGQLKSAKDDTVYKPPHVEPGVDMKLLREEAVLLLNELCFPRGQVPYAVRTHRSRACLTQVPLVPDGNAV